MGVDCATGAPEEIASHVLLAMGRQPNTDDLGLEAAGVATDRRGFVTVDDRLATSVPGIWALGECNGRGAFTHTAYNDYEIVAANLLDGGDRKLTDRLPAYALFTDPPLGRAGMTEAEARASGRRVLVGKRPMTRVSRAVEKGETHGLHQGPSPTPTPATSSARRSSASRATRRCTPSSTSCMPALRSRRCSAPSTSTRPSPNSCPPPSRRCSRSDIRVTRLERVSPQNGSAALMNGSWVWMRDQQSASAPSAAPDPLRENAARRVPPSL